VPARSAANIAHAVAPLGQVLLPDGRGVRVGGRRAGQREHHARLPGVGIGQVFGEARQFRARVGQRLDVGDELAVRQRHRLVVAGDGDVDERGQQCLLAAEDLVDGLHGDAGRRRHGRQGRGGVAGFDEQRGRRVQDRPAGDQRLLLSVGQLVPPLDSHRPSVVLFDRG
jgi:hypothetical protein